MTLNLGNISLLKDFILDVVFINNEPLIVESDYFKTEIEIRFFYGCSVDVGPDCPDYDGYTFVKVVKLFRGTKSDGYDIIWTNASDENDLNVVFPEIVNGDENKLLTYDFNKFSTFIDQIVTDYELRCKEIRDTIAKKEYVPAAPKMN